MLLSSTITVAVATLLATIQGASGAEPTGDAPTSAPVTTALAAAEVEPLVTHPVGVLAILLATLALIFQAARHPLTKRIFGIIPVLVFCYFVPTALATAHIIPHESPLYSWVKTFLLPASLLLLILALDLPGIARLGPKAGIMLLAGTFGVVIGGPIALFIGQLFPAGTVWAMPPEAWKGLAAMSGSWIGGGANFVAIGQAAGTTDAMLGLMVIVDVFVASLWMGTLLFLAAHQERVDRRLGADSSALRDLEHRLQDFQEKHARTPSLDDLLSMLALAFVFAALCYWAGNKIAGWVETTHSATQSSFLQFVLQQANDNLSGSSWKFILITAIGLVLSLTPIRRLEGAGASRLGSVMIYLLVACIGASANFRQVAECPGLIIVGIIWILIHVIVMVTTAIVIRAPLFFLAVGSQSNIGGAASAPVVAAAYSPALAPVGALLAVAGYVLGTYAGLICMWLLKWVAGAQ